MTTTVACQIEYVVGSTAKLRILPTVDGAPVDPVTITVTVKLPDASTVVETYPGNVVQEATGTYYLAFATTLEGLHHWQVETTTPNGLEESSFAVGPSSI